MTPTCTAPISDEMLISYWIGDGSAEAAEGVEAHLFECGSCAGRLGELASLGKGLKELARRGRLSGIVSRTLFNRMQRDGVRIRYYALSPGDTVPCTAFADDDLVVASLRGDFSKVEVAALTVTGPDASPVARFDDVPVNPEDGEVFWALPGDAVRQLPSIRLALTLTAAGDPQTVVGTYVLEHTAASEAAP